MTDKEESNTNTSDLLLDDWFQEESIVKASDLLLDDWLNIVLIPSDFRAVALFPDYCFPTDKHRDEYLADIEQREPNEVKSLIRRFLIPTGFFGGDLERIGNFLAKDPDAALQSEQVNRVQRGDPAWEGLTWVLDLLHRPQMAIDVIHAYLAAHFWWMPDWRINGLFDAMTLIRAAFLEPVHPRDLLLSLTPRDFEFLIALLFHRHGYDVHVTRSSGDGGYDVRLQNNTAGKAESSIVECKRYTKNVGVKELRSLLGVVEREHATRGLLVITSNFTSPARSEASQTNRIELVDYDKLCLLFNEHFGSEWLTNIDRLIEHARRQFYANANES